jgi:tyrosinase
LRSRTGSPTRCRASAPNTPSPRGTRRSANPLSGLVGNATDLAATEAHNAQYPDDEQRTKDLNEIVINLGYQFGPGSLDQYANPDTPIPPFPSGPVVYVSGINRARIAGSFVIAAHAEIDGKKQLIGYEAVLSRWHVAGCANCKLHLESKAAFPVPQRLQERVASLASSRPETITASVHTRGGLHGGVPLPIDAHARDANTPFKVELLHD